LVKIKNDMSWGREYIHATIKRLTYYKEIGEKTFEQLEEKDFHFQPDAESNSISVIVQHLAGNMLSRFTGFLTEDGEKEWRQRDQEFENHPYNKQQIMSLWENGWNCCLSAISALQEDDLLKTIFIRNEPLSVTDALQRQLAHYPYHIGQIVYLGKMIRGKNWKTLSIPRGQSQQFNETMKSNNPEKNS
jgi:hypothetical protein